MSDWLDRRAARRGFDTARGTDVLAREVGSRLAERLEYIKLEPQRVLDVGCGVGASQARLRARYPAAELIGIDYSLAALRDARAPAHWMNRLRGMLKGHHEHWVAADMAALPLPAASCQLLWSNLALAWAVDPLACLREWQRVLQIDGLLMFTTYGPDTLRELRAAFAAEDALPHVHPFIDMHDLGDMLVAAGFAEPVMDMEMLTLTYPAVPDVYAELHALGLANAHAQRRRSLTGRGLWSRVLKRYAAAAADGRVPATFEIVYGHAWKPTPRVTDDGRHIIQFAPHKTRPSTH